MVAKKLDYHKIEMMAAQLWRQQDIARVCDWTPEAFSKKKYEDPLLLRALENGYAIGKGKISAVQFELATEDKNPQMLIHLGKHHLEQRDSIKISGDPDAPIKVKIDFSGLTDEQIDELERIAIGATLRFEGDQEGKSSAKSA